MPEKISDQEMLVHECPTWEIFMHKVRERQVLEMPDGIYMPTYVFRGQGDNTWKLQSVFERDMTRFVSPGSKMSRDIVGMGLPDAYLDKFKRLATGLSFLRTREIDNDLEWWALGRHHGLITPLLDWTESPYVAAFFAFWTYLERQQGLRNFNPEGKTVSVWSLRIEDNLEVPDEFETFSRCIDQAHRQRAQQGLFTYLKHKYHWDIESYLASRGMLYCLERYDIPDDAMHVALNDLHLMGITFATMYPDFEGIAKEANLHDSTPNFRKHMIYQNGKKTQ